MDESALTPLRDTWQEAKSTQPEYPMIPEYLEKYYHWAYLDPRNARLLDRCLVTEFILMGHYRKLCNQVIDALPAQTSQPRVLQVACAYGDLTPRLARRLSPGGQLDVIDVSPMQIGLARDKTSGMENVHLDVQDSTRLKADDNSYDAVVLYFLLHEQPAEVRIQTLAEAVRVCRPGGKVLIADYHGPVRIHPLRYLLRPLLALLEPFALGLWATPLASILPEGAEIAHHRRFFGGLYQFAIIKR